MRDVEIPGGTAKFLETSGESRDEIPGRAVKLIKAGSMAALTQLSDYPELFEPPRMVRDNESGEDRPETPEERSARLDSRLKGMRLSVEQAMAFDNMREATVVALLHSWTLDRRLPTLETIGDLDGDLYSALLAAAGGMSAAELEENFKETGDPHDEVPTGGFGSSSDGSKASPQSTRTPKRQSDTSRSDGGASSPAQ